MCSRLLGVLIDNDPIGGIVGVGSIGNIKKNKKEKSHGEPYGSSI